MVACSAPSRPIRVTVSFANRLDHRCFAYLRVGGRVRLRICKARRHKGGRLDKSGRGRAERAESGRSATRRDGQSKKRKADVRARRRNLVDVRSPMNGRTISAAQSCPTSMPRDDIFEPIKSP